ncbi:MAG: hypothetical protein L0170_05075 [Acidobacteria bacterium]|nr:hypothetical protein [Acidobacteriota bacterium]
MPTSILRFSNQESAAPRATGFEAGSAYPLLEVAVEALSRMRYFHDLLEQGYRHALQPGEDPDTLRTRRVALGISLPELDLVPLWSRRAQDGTFSIPFIDFLLDQFLESLEVPQEPALSSTGSCYAQRESDQFRDEPVGESRPCSSHLPADPGRPLPFRGDAGAAVRPPRGAGQNPAPMRRHHFGRRLGVGED